MMDIQSIQIAGIVNISESNYNIAVDSHKCMMLRQCFIPLFLINEIRSPRIDLLLGIILDIDQVYCGPEEIYNLNQVVGIVTSDLHINS